MLTLCPTGKARQSFGKAFVVSHIGKEWTELGFEGRHDRHQMLRETLRSLGLDYQRPPI